MTTETKHVEGNTGRIEILDFKNQPILYSRLLLASQKDQTEEISQAINPDDEAIATFYTSPSLDSRNYTPILENLSFNERREQWKGIEFSDAYSQWRTKFTYAIQNINDEKRAEALKIIFPNKETNEFALENADALFKDFSDGKSDTHRFIKRAITNLTREGKIDVEYLKVLLPHLEWLATGLFGKNTAQITAGLIELESNIFNDPQDTIINLIASKNFRGGKIPIPESHEKDILHLLYSSLNPTTESVGVSSEDDDEDNLPVAPPHATSEPTIPHSSPVANSTDEEDQSPTPSIPVEIATGTEHDQGRIFEAEPTGIEGNDEILVRLKINGEDTGIVWEQLRNRIPLDLSDHEPLLEKFHYEDRPNRHQRIPLDYISLPHGMFATIKFYAKENRFYFDLIGGDGVKIPLKELVKMGCQIDLKSEKYVKGREIFVEYQVDKNAIISPLSSSSYFDEINVSANEAFDILRTVYAKTQQSNSLPSSQANPVPPVSHQTQQSNQQPEVNKENPPVNSVIELGRGKMDLKTELNQKLSQSQNRSETFSAPATTLKDYVITLVDDIEVEDPGKLEVKNNQMYITGLSLKKSVMFIMDFSGTLDLIISNSKNGGIQAEGKIDTESNKFRKTAEKAIKNMNSNIKKRLDDEISPTNPRWKSGTISISGDKILITFNKTA